MNFLKRGSLDIIRNPGKTLTLLCLVLIIGLFWMGAITIRNAIYKTEQNLSSKMPPVSTLYWNYIEAERSGIDLSPTTWEQPTLEMITQVAELPYVRDYDVRITHHLFSRDLEWEKPVINVESIPDDMTFDQIATAQNSWHDQGAYLESFPTVGINITHPIDFQGGLLSLASGRFMTQDELDKGSPVAIISQTLTDANDLQIGSHLMLDNNIYDFSNLTEEERVANPFNFILWHLDEYVVARHDLCNF